MELEIQGLRKLPLDQLTIPKGILENGKINSLKNQKLYNDVTIYEK